MRSVEKRFFSFFIFSVAVLWLLSFEVSDGLGFKLYSSSSVTNPVASKIPEWIKPYPFYYNPKGRPDPFKAAIKVKSFKVARKKKKILSPLDEYEPTQLNLVGIVWDPARKTPPLALVELPNGKGYLLKEGMKIGPNDAEVVAILKDRIIFVEKVVNLFGKVEKKQIILNLKPKK